MGFKAVIEAALDLRKRLGQFGDLKASAKRQAARDCTSSLRLHGRRKMSRGLEDRQDVRADGVRWHGGRCARSLRDQHGKERTHRAHFSGLLAQRSHCYGSSAAINACTRGSDRVHATRVGQREGRTRPSRFTLRTAPALLRKIKPWKRSATLSGPWVPPSSKC